MKLQIQQTPVDKLLPYARNARTHSDGQVAQIAASIKEFGFCNPVLIDGDGGIIAGHGRVLAARKLGMAEVPTITLGHLTDTQRRAYILADNKLALNAGWDEELLKLELDELRAAGVDLDLIGFDAGDITGKKIPTWDNSGLEDDRGKRSQTGKGGMVVSIGKVSAVLNYDTVQALAAKVKALAASEADAVAIFVTRCIENESLFDPQ